MEFGSVIEFRGLLVASYWFDAPCLAFFGVSGLPYSPLRWLLYEERDPLVQLPYLQSFCRPST